jgi:uridine kinase
MREFVAEDLPIQHNVISYRDALTYFKQNNMPHTVLLLKYHNRSKVSIYECGAFIDIAHGPLLSRSGELKNFEILNYAPGFLLRYPKFGGKERVPPFKDHPILFSIYKEYKNWGQILNMNCIGYLNQLIDETQHKEFILISEALHDKKIASIADTICHKKDKIQLILVAGPSSSGKTTFAKKLAIQLKVLGRNPVTISIDDYFLTKDKTPLDEFGKPNYETLDAIDVALLNEQLVRLFDGETIFVPNYNFATGERDQQGKPLKLPRRPCLILEGIHGLNDNLIQRITRDRTFKIYVSALTQLNLDDHNRISTTDNRLLRRMVRDYKFRGYSALKILTMWPSVRRGEDSYIFPFQNTADAAFNSALDYELAVLKVYAEPLLRSITPEHREYAEAARLLSFLNNILPIPPTWVPQQSILREFIGESIFY